MSSQRIALVHDPVIKISPLFQGFSELELNAVSAFLEPRRIREGELVFNEGTAGEEMFILISGNISASVTQPDGTPRSMFEIHPGEFFGEMSVIANESRSATLTARTDSELLVLHGIDFYRIIYEHPMIGIKILKAIGKVQNKWLLETSKDLGDLLRWGETASRRAVADELTDLYNRGFLEQSARSRFEYGSVGLRSISLLMMDMDKLHEINDRYGNKAGDLILIATADILRSITRSGDICARLSGDEFALLLPDTEIDEASTIADRIRQAIASLEIEIPGNNGEADSDKVKVSVCISIGIAAAPAHANTWEDLLKSADAALFHAKEMGRNRIVIARRVAKTKEDHPSH